MRLLRGVVSGQVRDEARLGWTFSAADLARVRIGWMSPAGPCFLQRKRQARPRIILVVFYGSNFFTIARSTARKFHILNHPTRLLGPKVKSPRCRRQKWSVFHRFDDFPTELRLAIWRQCLLYCIRCRADREFGACDASSSHVAAMHGKLRPRRRRSLHRGRLGGAYIHTYLLK